MTRSEQNSLSEVRMPPSNIQEKEKKEKRIFEKSSIECECECETISATEKREQLEIVSGVEKRHRGVFQQEKMK